MAAAKAKPNGARKCMTRRIPKPEGRRPKEGRNPNSEGTSEHERCHLGAAELHQTLVLLTLTLGLLPIFGFRTSDCRIRASDFGLLSAFGLRVSVFSSSPHLRLAQLLEQQVLQIGVGTRSEEVDAAALAVLAQPLHEVLHGLPIRL